MIMTSYRDTQEEILALTCLDWTLKACVSLVFCMTFPAVSVQQVCCGVYLCACSCGDEVTERLNVPWFPPLTRQ